MFDLGQNITGWAFIKVRGPEGSQVTLRYGERIYEDGTLDQEELSRFIWTGDALLVAETGLFNYDVVRAYLKWIDDFTDEQRPNGQLPGIIPTSGWGYTYGRGENRERGYGPQWEGAFMEIPWQMYRFTGDTSIIEKYYDREKGIYLHGGQTPMALALYFGLTEDLEE